VRGGFEPPVQFPVRQFSKLLVSATHPPHRLDVSDYAFFKAQQKYKKDAQEQNKSEKKSKCKLQNQNTKKHYLFRLF
jgi:hypothetical protein